MGGVGAEASGARVEAAPQRRVSFSALLDGFFFVFAGLAAIWLAFLLFTESFTFGWWGILGFVLFWALLAYLVLPRLHRILTTIYVPDYFIGRARTSDGLLGDPVNLAVRGAKFMELAAVMGEHRYADDVSGSGCQESNDFHR
ncbi:LssY C-terminal domain-containing protein [Agromyces humi]|uniref:LssY C-terminal domain-containing protein n=1 Tax=Agromyces humi TaxID=1766800 RepID=UPI001F491B5B|nr:LssY C-terminal domain-containing protein [Agromyces humi]